jgi:hypothetical protein
LQKGLNCLHTIYNNSIILIKVFTISPWVVVLSSSNTFKAVFPCLVVIGQIVIMFVLDKTKLFEITTAGR